jgi:acetyl esterase/lipase
MNLLVTIGTALLSWLAPGGTHVVKGLRYADHDRGTLDVYEPERATPGAPLVVFIYGGSWESGEKSMYRFVGKLLASRGFVTVIPDYRVYPAVKYPVFLQDNAEAVAFARSHAAEWGADPHRLFLAGHSAGAYDVAMLGLDRRWLGAVGLDPRRDVAGVVGLAGPYDFLPLQDAKLKVIFGPKDTRPDTQPINHVDGMAPPMLLFAGSKDKTVDPGNTSRLAAAIQARRGTVTARIVPGKTHIGLLVALLPALGGHSEILDAVVNFIDTTPLPVAAALKSAA